MCMQDFIDDKKTQLWTRHTVNNHDLVYRADLLAKSNHKLYVCLKNDKNESE